MIENMVNDCQFTLSMRGLVLEGDVFDMWDAMALAMVTLTRGPARGIPAYGLDTNCDAAKGARFSTSDVIITLLPVTPGTPAFPLPPPPLPPPPPPREWLECAGGGWKFSAIFSPFVDPLPLRPEVPLRAAPSLLEAPRGRLRLSGASSVRGLWCVRGLGGGGPTDRRGLFRKKAAWGVDAMET